VPPAVAVRGTRCEDNNKKMRKTIIILILSVGFINLNAQANHSTENEYFVFWQPNTKINFSHFQAESDTSCIFSVAGHNFQMSATIRLESVVDIPKRRRDRRRKFDRLYLAPVFCKHCSCILSEDSLELKAFQLLFDIAEVSARGIRRDLSEFREKANAVNLYSMWFTTVRTSWENTMRGIWASIFRDVFIEPKEDAYKQWRETVNEFLKQSETHATRPEEIYRFIRGKPVERGYQVAPTIMGDLGSR